LSLAIHLPKPSLPTISFSGFKRLRIVMLVVEKKPGHGEGLDWTPPELFPNLLTPAASGFDAV
jgi:hypothetical protein